MEGHQKFLGGGGVLKVKILEAKYEAKLEFPGGMGGAKQKTFCGGSMDIFWNCTLTVSHSLLQCCHVTYVYLVMWQQVIKNHS